MYQRLMLRHWKKFLLAVSALFLWFYSLGSNNDQEWLIIQYPWGKVKVIDTPGMFFKGGAATWFYPRNWQVKYDSAKSFKVVFNDGGSATMNAMVRFSSPITLEGKRRFHQLFGGSEEAVEAAVWAHLSDSMKSSGPVMSASEHQSSRRGEFTFLVQEQLQKGLFEMRRVSRILQDQFDDKGKPITVYATEVVMEENNVAPKISRNSPIADFGIVITQFSITDVVYDEQTQRQFAQKKDAFLSAEGSKAQREKEVQERLMVEERGRREKAETESLALRQKAEAVIKAQKEKEVEETNAARRVAVALLEKQEAETRAAQELEVARFAFLKAKEEAEAQIVLASAKEKSLKLAGHISERDRVLAEIEKEKAIGIAKSLANVNVPKVIFMGNSQGTSSNDSLMNLFLMKKLGVIED